MAAAQKRGKLGRARDHQPGTQQSFPWHYYNTEVAASPCIRVRTLSAYLARYLRTITTYHTSSTYLHR